MLTILTWLWEQPGGRTKFTMDHVAIWADMVERNISMPHRLACVTTMKGLPAGIVRIEPPGEFENITSRRWGNGRPNCFRRLSMFRRDAAEIFGERFVCMDLDCIIAGSLDPLFNRSDDLVLFKGTHTDRPYNGSMMLIKAGCRPHVYEDFDQAGADASGEKFCGSDQAWLAHSLGWHEKTWYERHGVYHYGSIYKALNKSNAAKLGNLKVLFFPGKMKPWTLAEMRIDKFVTANYQRTPVKEVA
jgi:hypothetical protein